MAKQRHEEARNSSPKTAYAVMALGAVIVVALLAWALTRQVEPATPAAATSVENAPPAGQPPAATPASTDPGATAAPEPSHEDTASVQRIAVEDLRAKANRGEVTIIDVRDASSYAMAHIPGAVSMPLATIEAQIDTLPKGKQIVTYCT